jgi:hypothetical protein
MGPPRRPDRGRRTAQTVKRAPCGSRTANSARHAIGCPHSRACATAGLRSLPRCTRRPRRNIAPRRRAACEMCHGEQWRTSRVLARGLPARPRRQGTDHACLMSRRGSSTPPHWKTCGGDPGPARRAGTPLPAPPARGGDCISPALARVSPVARRDPSEQADKRPRKMREASVPRRSAPGSSMMG